MHKLGTIFYEILKLFPRYQFEKGIERYHGDRYVKTFNTWQQFITLLYSQIKQKDSLRDIEAGKFRFKNPLYTIDASTIDLCLSVFPWAKFRKTKAQ
jgi:hypothetical protein